jgi:predicted nucleic acid-binding Zn ribbon protein
MTIEIPEDKKLCVCGCGELIDKFDKKGKDIIVLSQLVMFAVLAAFGLVTAMLAVPIVPQAHARAVPSQSTCHNLAQGQGAGPIISGCAKQ